MCLVGRRGKKISHLSNRNEKKKWSKINLFSYLCSDKSTMRVTMTRNNNVYKTIWKSGNKKYKNKYICYFFTIWNLKSRVMDKRGHTVLSRTSLYFSISNLILLFLYSFHAPCIILSNVRSMFPFLFNRSQLKVEVVNQMSHPFFEAQKYFFALSNFLKLVIFATFQCWSMLLKSTWKTETLFRRNLTLFGVVNFNIDIHNIVSTLIWHWGCDVISP